MENTDKNKNKTETRLNQVMHQEKNLIRRSKIIRNLNQNKHNQTESETIPESSHDYIFGIVIFWIFLYKECLILRSLLLLWNNPNEVTLLRSYELV